MPISIELLKIKPILLIWLACIEDKKNMYYIHKFWGINSKWLYKKRKENLKRMEEAGLIEFHKDIIYSKLDFLKDYKGIDKFFERPDLFGELHKFRINTPEERLKILNSDAFRKACMSKDAIMLCLDHLVYGSRKASIENNKINYYEIEIDWEFLIFNALSILSVCKNLSEGKINWDVKKLSQNNDILGRFHQECLYAFNIIKKNNYKIPKEIEYSTYEDLIISLANIYFSLRESYMWKDIEWTYKQMKNMEKEKKKNG